MEELLQRRQQVFEETWSTRLEVLDGALRARQQHGDLQVGEGGREVLEGRGAGGGAEGAVTCRWERGVLRTE